MVQALLAERFQLKVSREVKELPVYALVIAKGGPKLTAAARTPTCTPSGTAEPGTPRIGRGFRFEGPGKIDAYECRPRVLCRRNALPNAGDRRPSCVNKTGLTGIYNFTLKWTPETTAPGAEGPGGSASAPTGEDPAPGLFTALEEQLGLKLESQKGSVETIVVDHIELPTPN